MMNIGIDDKNSAQVVKILSRVLADEYVLYTKTRGYHWNVVGMQTSSISSSKPSTRPSKR